MYMYVELINQKQKLALLHPIQKFDVYCQLLSQLMR